MWFDAKAALRKIELQPPTPATTATFATQAPEIRPHVTDVAEVAAPTARNAEIPDIDEFEERAAIVEYDGGLTRADAEQLAAECQDYENVVAFRAAQSKEVNNV